MISAQLLIAGLEGLADSPEASPGAETRRGNRAKVPRETGAEPGLPAEVLGTAAKAGDIRPPALPQRGIQSSMTTTREAPPTRPALVLDRWNSWVRVYLPETGETRWVDLGQTQFTPLTASGSADPSFEPTR